MPKLFLFIFVVLLSACTNGASTPPIEKKGPGSFFTGKDEQGISLLELGKPSQGDGGLPINALLWRASLDITSSIPLDDVDTFGGTIVTEWYQLNDADNERIKLAVFVLDRELRSDGIRVVVYVQNRENGEWRDNGTDGQMGLQLEELILTRAREIRAKSVNESN